MGDPEKYANKIRSRYPKIKITVSKKADSLFPIVSASSICAKVVRDQIVQAWRIDEFDDEKPPIAYGSGYPGGKKQRSACLVSPTISLDPQTKRFLTESIEHIFGFPKFVRFSWSTAATIIEKKCVKVTWFVTLECQRSKMNPSLSPRDDDDDENVTTATAAATRKRKSDVMKSSTATTKTLFSYFGQKSASKSESTPRRLAGSEFFRAARLKPAVFPL